MSLVKPWRLPLRWAGPRSPGGLIEFHLWPRRTPWNCPAAISESLMGRDTWQHINHRHALIGGRPPKVSSRSECRGRPALQKARFSRATVPDHIEAARHGFSASEHTTGTMVMIEGISPAPVRAYLLFHLRGVALADAAGPSFSQRVNRRIAKLNASSVKARARSAEVETRPDVRSAAPRANQAAGFARDRRDDTERQVRPRRESSAE